MKRPLFVILVLAAVAPMLGQQPSAAELFNRGLLLERAEGMVTEAIELYERVVSQFPNDKDTRPRALHRLGTVYEARNDARATATFSMLATEFPGSPLGDDARLRLDAKRTEVPGQPANSVSTSRLDSAQGCEHLWSRVTRWPTTPIFGSDQERRATVPARSCLWR